MPLVFRRVESFEQLVHTLWIEAHASIPHDHTHTVAVVPFRADHHLPRAIIDARHRVGRVQQQVQNDLLQLDAIADDRRADRRPVPAAEPPGFSAGHSTTAQSPLASPRSGPPVRCVDSFLLNRARNRVITSDARLPSRIVRRAVSRAPSTSGRIGVQHPQARARVGDDAGQRLVDFVRDRRRQNSEARDSGHVRELRSGLVKCLLRQPARRDILNRRDVLQLTILVPRRMSDGMQVLDRVVRHQQTVLPLKVVGGRLVPGRPFSVRRTN